MYSENVALRMVILDGQLLHEGDSAGPGVVVERIKPRSAVLRAGAQRVEVGW
jgi:general secretion pathway protein B